MTSSFTVNITEEITQSFEIEASTATEALELARSRYRSGELVVDCSRPFDVETRFETFDSDRAEWISE